MELGVPVVLIDLDPLRAEDCGVTSLSHYASEGRGEVRRLANDGALTATARRRDFTWCMIFRAPIQRRIQIVWGYLMPRGGPRAGAGRPRNEPPMPTQPKRRGQPMTALAYVEALL